MTALKSLTAGPRIFWKHITSCPSDSLSLESMMEDTAWWNHHLSGYKWGLYRDWKKEAVENHLLSFYIHVHYSLWRLELNLGAYPIFSFSWPTTFLSIPCSQCRKEEKPLTLGVWTEFEYCLLHYILDVFVQTNDYSHVYKFPHI